MSNATRGVLHLIIVIAAASLGACSDNDPPMNTIDAPPGCTVTDANVMIMNNHVHTPHKLVVTSAEVQAAADKMYDIMGTAAHTHMLTITAADFATLMTGGTLMITTTSEIDHTHLVTISC